MLLYPGQRENVRDSLYLYCSMATFMKIITRKTIRFSNVYKMNDYSEVLHILDFLPNALQAEYMNAPFDFTYNDIKNQFAFDTIIDYMKKDIISSKYLTYVACYSEDGNDLAQWRGYGDDGKGVAIRYDGEALYDLCVLCSILPMVRVEYDDESKSIVSNNIAKDILRQLKHALEHHNVKNGQSKYEDMVRIMLSSSIAATLINCVEFKHESYKNEKEWRLRIATEINETHSDGCKKYYRDNEYGVGIIMKKIAFTEKGEGGLSSYFDLCFERFEKPIITGIMLGPRSKSSKDDLDLRCFLDTYGFEDVSIDKSDIPYVR